MSQTILKIIRIYWKVFPNQTVSSHHQAHQKDLQGPTNPLRVRNYTYNFLDPALVGQGILIMDITLQKFGTWGQINCLDKRIKICHILYTKTKVAFFISCYFIFSLWMPWSIPNFGRVMLLLLSFLFRLVNVRVQV